MKTSVLVLIAILISFCGFAKEPTIKTKVVVGLYSSPPFVVIKNDGTISGVSVELWDKIANTLGIKYETKLYSDSEIDKLVTDVETGYIDLAIGSITINQERLNKVEFTLPYFTTKLGIASINTGAEWYTMFKGFASKEFISILGLLCAVLLVLGFVIWLIERGHNPDFSTKWWGILDGAYFISVVMATVGFGDKKPITALGKVVTVIWMFVALGITSLFISSLSSSMTINKMEGKITNMGDLKKLKVATLAGTTADAYLVKHGVKHYNYAGSSKALEDIEKKELDAYVDDITTLQYLVSQNGFSEKITVSDKQFDVQFYGMALRKDDNLRTRINPLILKFIKDDDWHLILYKYHLAEKNSE